MKLLSLIITTLFLSQAFAQKITSSIDLGSGVIVNAVVEQFNPKQHKFDTCDTGLGWKTICLIDGKVGFGTDEGLTLPINQLTQLSIKIKGKEIPLDVSGMYNPSIAGQLTKTQFKLESRGEEHTFYGYFSDGAGVYTAHWIVLRGKSLRQVISRDEQNFDWRTE